MPDPKKFTCHKYVTKMVLEELHQNEEVNPKKERHDTKEKKETPVMVNSYLNVIDTGELNLTFKIESQWIMFELMNQNIAMCISFRNMAMYKCQENYLK